MDIQALRARALETKKRKRVRPDTPTAPSLRADDDLEEGEIDDGALVNQTPTYTTALNGDDRVRAVEVQRTSSATASVNEHAAPTPPSVRPGSSIVPGTGQSSSAARSVCERVATDAHCAAAAVREESKRVITELLSYGVLPAYLLSIGVSHRTLSMCFRDLNLDIVLPDASEAGMLPSAWNEPAADPLARSTHGVQQSPPTASTRADLTALEARKREELLARKAALLARNQQHAQSLESELDSLFSAAPALPAPDAASPTASPNLSPADDSVAIPASAKRKTAQQQTLAQKKRRLDASAESFTPNRMEATDTAAPKLTAQAVHDLRESLDHTEEVVNTPQGGPFASTSSGGLHTSASLAASSSSQPRGWYSAAGRPRPSATEFEHEPTVPLSSTSLLRGRNGRAFIADEPVRMVIEISDDEDDSDDDGRQPNADSPDSHFGPSRHKSSETEQIDPSPRVTGPLTPTAADNANSTKETERIRQLQEKETAIKMMMERIAEIERRKKDLAKGRSSDSASMSRTSSVDAAQIADPVPAEAPVVVESVLAIATATATATDKEEQRAGPSQVTISCLLMRTRASQAEQWTAEVRGSAFRTCRGGSGKSRLARLSAYAATPLRITLMKPIPPTTRWPILAGVSALPFGAGTIPSESTRPATACRDLLVGLSVRGQY